MDTFIPKPEEDISNPHQKAIDILKEIKEEIKVTVKKPEGWSRKSVSSYYRVKFALEIKHVIDEMVSTGKDRIFRYDKFTKLPYRFSANTLYSYVYQSLRFLKTETIEGISRAYYSPILDRIVTTREPGLGIRLSFHTAITSSDVDMSPDEVETQATNNTLITKVRDWMENATVGDMLELTKLALTEQEIEDVQDTLAGTQSFLEADITSKQIKILKTA